MAQSATVYNFDIELAHVDRGVYESLSVRVACQPSETAEYLVSRVLAWCLEHDEGIAFSRGIAEADTPALSVRDLTGALRVWIDVGAPDADRLHKASKASPRVVIYTHRDPQFVARQLAGTRIHRAEALELYGFDRDLIATLVSKLDRRNRWAVSITDGHIYVTLDGATADGALTRVPLV